MAVKYINLDVSYRLRNKKAIAQWIKQTIENEKKETGEATIALCSNDYILKVNIEYLKHDYFTDIITFDYSKQKILSGDLLISIDTVKNNAKEYNVTFQNELRRVIIHGILHLCGYKDNTEIEQKIVREKENYYLERIE